MFEQQFSHNNWMDLYREVLCYFYKEYTENFNKFIDNPIDFGINHRDKASSPKISRNFENIHKPCREMCDDVYFFSGAGVLQIMKDMIIICKELGFSENNCPIRFTVV